MPRSTTLDELILVSVDDHIIEPPELFAGRLPSKQAARVAKLEGVNETGLQAWTRLCEAADPALKGSG